MIYIIIPTIIILVYFGGLVINGNFGIFHNLEVFLRLFGVLSGNLVYYVYYVVYVSTFWYVMQSNPALRGQILLVFSSFHLGASLQCRLQKCRPS
jgi:hypothetical protein